MLWMKWQTNCAATFCADRAMTIVSLLGMATLCTFSSYEHALLSAENSVSVPAISSGGGDKAAMENKSELTHFRPYALDVTPST